MNSRESDALPAVECRNIYKIFGDSPADVRSALDAIISSGQLGLSKDEVRERFRCVIAVADVNFTVAREEIFCIMGLSGSGKSTLLRHMNRLIEPTAGNVFIQGENVNEMANSELYRLRAETIGMVFQNMALFPHRTVLDNVAYGLEVRKVPKSTRYKAAREKLELVKLEGWGDKYPHQLSGGMQQRVGLARALAADPDILLMDEPFSALDPLIRRELQEEFLNLSKVMRKTTIFITHDLDEAIRLGTRIAIMNDGEFVQVGIPEEIMLRPAEDYVARFVEGESVLRFLKAGTLMYPLREYVDRNGSDLNGFQRTPANASFEDLIKLCTSSDKPVVVIDDEGQAIGVVTKNRILRAVAERASSLTGKNQAERTFKAE